MTKPSRQIVWQRKKVAAGLCCSCGKPQGASSSQKRCLGCLKKMREIYHRKHPNAIYYAEKDA